MVMAGLPFGWFSTLYDFLPKAATVLRCEISMERCGSKKRDAMRPAQCGKKFLPPPFMGEVGRWIRAKPGATGPEGVPTFHRKVGIFAYLRSKYADSPPAFGHPPHL